MSNHRNGFQGFPQPNRIALGTLINAEPAPERPNLAQRLGMVIQDLLGPWVRGEISYSPSIGMLSVRLIRPDETETTFEVPTFALLDMTTLAGPLYKGVSEAKWAKPTATEEKEDLCRGGIVLPE